MTFWDAVSLILSTGWKALSIPYPGLGVSFGTILIGAFLCVFSLRIIGYIGGFSFGVSSASKNVRSLVSNKKSRKSDKS